MKALVLLPVQVDSVNLKHVIRNMLLSRLSDCIRYPQTLGGTPAAGAKEYFPACLSLRDGWKMPFSPSFLWAAGRKAEEEKPPLFIVTHPVKSNTFLP